MSSGLDFTQLRAFTAFRRGVSVAILGGAGSGKSFVLNRILQDARQRQGHDGVVACAWTNQAAVTLHGRTIHAWFGVPSGFNFDQEELWRKVKRNGAFCASLGKIETILIDEISILKDKVLDAIDLVMRHTARTARLACLPMGGRQLILAGDPFQLEPVGVDYGTDGEKHVFSARAWILPFGGFGSGVIAILRGNHRQGQDEEFYGILTRIREGSATEEDISRINSTGSSISSPPRSHTVLCLLRSEVDSVNKSELALIPGPEFHSKAVDVFKENCTCELRKRLHQTAQRTVTVKKGCEILLPRKVDGICPGTRGTVLSCRKFSHVGAESKLLTLDEIWHGKGQILRVNPMRFEVYNCDTSVMACRMQLSIVSAYALTVHRSQGLSLQNVAMDFTKVGTWIPTGLAYVALSRCTSMDGLWLRGFQKKHIVVSKHAENVMADIRKLKKYFQHRVIACRKALLCNNEEANESENSRKKRTLEVGNMDRTKAKMHKVGSAGRLRCGKFLN